MAASDTFAQAIAFADKAYKAGAKSISSRFQTELLNRRNELANQGVIRSSVTVVESGRIHGERINELLQLRTKVLLEGCDLRGVELDGGNSAAMIKDVIDLRESLINDTTKEIHNDPVCGHLFTESQYRMFIVKHIEVSADSVEVEIERHRHRTKLSSNSVSVVQSGDNARVNLNSSDNSTNVVSKSGNRSSGHSSERQEIPDATDYVKVLAWASGVIGPAMIAIAQVINSEHRIASWWLTSFGALLTIAAVSMILYRKLPAVRRLLVGIAVVIGLTTIGVFWEFRPIIRDIPGPGQAIQKEPDQTQEEELKHKPGDETVPVKSPPAHRDHRPVENKEKKSLPTQSCPQGICIGGDNNGTATVINREPLPKISWTVRELPIVGGKRPAINIDLSPDESFSAPAFSATCTRPCESESGGLSTGGRMFMPQTGWDDLNPNIAILSFQMPSIIRKGEPVHWVIRSKDDQPVVIHEVHAIRF